ncbi:MAG: hypothetical protein IJA07_08650 [Agathobacter sp.]|nr:hypothetical protein [Agathobacter sp.]
MFEQDYIMRLVHEIARALAKILFNIDTETVTEKLEARIEELDILEALLDMVDYGQINEAENKLYDLLEEGAPNCIEMAILFYSHLNEKTDAFLKENDYSRDEIKTGMETIAERVGLNGVLEVGYGYSD